MQGDVELSQLLTAARKHALERRNRDAVEADVFISFRHAVVPVHQLPACTAVCCKSAKRMQCISLLHACMFSLGPCLTQASMKALATRLVTCRHVQQQVRHCNKCQANATYRLHMKSERQRSSECMRADNATLHGKCQR